MQVSGMSSGAINDAGELTEEELHFDMLSFMSQLGYTLLPPATEDAGE